MAFGNPIPDQQNLQLTLQPEAALQLTKFVLEHTTDAAFWVRPDAQLVYVNDAACCALEYSQAELLTMTIHYISPDLPHWSAHWQMLKQRGTLTFESRHRARGGRVFPVGISITYVECQGRAYSCALARNVNQSLQAEVDLAADTSLTAIHLEKRASLGQGRPAQPQQVPEPPPADTAKAAAPQSLPSNPQLSEVFDFIEANYRQPISLREVAQAVGYSPTYLTDLVRRQTGQTVHQWIVERWMTAACSLLLETNQTVEQIAEVVGYRYVGCFFRQFRQSFGIPPKAWGNAGCT